MKDTLLIEVVRKTITVDCAVEEAFRVFTADTVSWWPVESHSIHETVSEIVFEPEVGGEVYEISTSGERGHWAQVVEWDPPSRLVLGWNILGADAVATEVEVRFLADGARTRVELEHRGWDGLGEDAPARRGNYETGWDFVLGRFDVRTNAVV